MPEYRVETLGPNDYDALVDLWKAAELMYRPTGRDARDSIVSQMALPTCRFLGIRGSNGELLGGAIATHEGRKGWVNRLAVRKSSQRQGIGRELVAACEEWLFGSGILIIASLVEGDNLPSQRLFEACSYERDDTIVYFRKRVRPGV